MALFNSKGYSVFYKKGELASTIVGALIYIDYNVGT